ncbi:MAG: zinc-dependent metalloprotease family protein [bacterium]
MPLLPTGRRALAAAALFGTLALAFCPASPASATTHFHEISPDGAARAAYPASSRFFTADLADLRGILAGAPLDDFSRRSSPLVITLPLPDGTEQRFEVWDSPVMHPALAARYPEIKTYFVRGLDDRTATGRLDTTPHGFHAMIMSAQPMMFIDPLSLGNTSVYVSHFERPRDQSFTCQEVITPAVERELDELMRRSQDNPAPLAVTGPQLRTYRAAIAADREYSTYYGGTVPLALAGVVTSLNRVNQVYERDVAVHMELIANDDAIIYTAEPDPYTNNDGATMLGQNQTNLDTVIGTANYDIGHVFSTGGGGIAGVGVVCRAGQKARGVTGSPAPIGDNFDIDYVAHEMGHQYSGTHTFNSIASACNGNRTASTAYEPGSGSTVMSYAGICSPDNLQLHSDPDMCANSFDRICNYTQTGAGSTCPVVTNTGNNPPTCDAGNAGLTIPKSTPFLLAGTGSDPDGDTVTYSWEELDIGPAGSPNSPTGDAPIFRSFSPKSVPWRSFPKKMDIRNNTQTIGEILPSYARTLHFRLTVRDGLGGVSNSPTLALAVTDLAGPFRVTSVDATPWDYGTQKTITWDVAGTDVAPVSSPSVNILLSTDNGATFPIVLASATANDGSEVVNVPALAVATSLARVQVEGVGNVFFDWNDAAFVVNAGPVGAPELAHAGSALELRPNPFTNQTSVAYSVARSGSVTLRVFDVAGRLVSTLVNAPQEAGRHTVDWNGYDSNGRAASAGVYFVRLETPGEARTVRTLRLR